MGMCLLKFYCLDSLSAVSVIFSISDFVFRIGMPFISVLTDLTQFRFAEQSQGPQRAEELRK